MKPKKLSNKTVLQKSEENRRLALLSLMAEDRKEEKSNCISSGDLAALIDQETKPSEADKIYNHLANCQSCYEEWKTLSEQLSDYSSQKSPRLVRLFHSKKLIAAVGSSFAIAASVLLYLGIPPEQHKEIYLLDEGGIEQRQQAEEISSPDTAADISPKQPEPVAAPRMELKQPEPRLKKEKSAKPIKRQADTEKLKKHTEAEKNAEIGAAESSGEISSPLQRELSAAATLIDDSPPPSINTIRQQIISMCLPEKLSSPTPVQIARLKSDVFHVLEVTTPDDRRRTLLVDTKTILESSAPEHLKNVCGHLLQIWDAEDK